MLKAERPTSAEWHDEVCKFLASGLDAGAGYGIESGLFTVMTGSGFFTVFVNRDEAGKILGCEVWLTMPNPLMKGRRLMRNLASVGDLTTEFTLYRRAAFDSFPEGTE